MGLRMKWENFEDLGLQVCVPEKGWKLLVQDARPSFPSWQIEVWKDGMVMAFDVERESVREAKRRSIKAYRGLQAGKI